MNRTLALAACLTLAACSTTRVVTVRCVTPEQVEELRKAAPPHIRDRLTGKADEDVRILAGSALRLRGYSDELLGILEICSR